MKDRAVEDVERSGKRRVDWRCLNNACKPIEFLRTERSIEDRDFANAAIEADTTAAVNDAAKTAWRVFAKVSRRVQGESHIFIVILDVFRQVAGRQK